MQQTNLARFEGDPNHTSLSLLEDTSFKKSDTDLCVNGLRFSSSQLAPALQLATKQFQAKDVIFKSKTWIALRTYGFFPNQITFIRKTSLNNNRECLSRVCLSFVSPNFVTFEWVFFQYYFLLNFWTCSFLFSRPCC